MFFLKKVLFLYLLLFCSFEIEAVVNKKMSKKLIGIYYYKNILGQIHLNPSKYSTSLTTIACGHPVKVYQISISKNKKQILFAEKYNYAKVGPYEGYILRSFLSKKRVLCFQDKYSRLYESFKLDISEMYYLGKLYDQYVHGKSKVK